MVGGMGRMAGRGGSERPPPEQRRFTDRELLGRYLQLVRPYRWSLGLVFLLYFSNAVLNLLPGIAAWLLIDIFVQHETVERLGITIDSATLFPDAASSVQGALYFAAAVVVLIIIANLIGVAMWRFGTRVSQHFLLDLKQRVHMHLHKLHISYFERERTGSIMSRCVSDVEQMDQMIRQSFNLFYGCIHLLGVPFVMLVMSPMLFCFVLPPIPIIVFAVWRIRRRLRPLYRRLREQQAEVGAAIQEQISGIKEIKAFGQEGPAHRTYTRANIALVRTHLDAMRVFSVNHQLLYGNRDFANLLVALGGGLLVIYGLGNVTVGVLIGFLPLLTRFFDPINQLVGFYDVIQRGLASTERVFEFLDIEPEVQDRPDARWVDLREATVAIRATDFL
ncbi:MAG: ABC transporter transmembrane domain-containing protein, partial [Planctomycetota bacterium]